MHKVMGLFRDEESAKRAVKKFRQQGISEDRISLIARHDKGDDTETSAGLNGDDAFNLGDNTMNNRNTNANLEAVQEPNIARNYDGVNTANSDTEAGAMGERRKDSVGDGIATGGALGGIAGILAGAGMLAIPGVGPILAAGPLATGLSGLAAGGLAGGLIDYGIDEDTGERYATEIESGRILVALEDDDENRIEQAEEILTEYGAYSIQRK